MAEEEKKAGLLPDSDQLEAYAKRIQEFVRANQKTMIMAASALVLLAVIISGVIYFQKKAEEKAQALLGQAITQIEAASRSNAGDRQYAEIKPQLKKLIDQYGGTDAGKAARLKYADLCYQTGDYAAAIETYRAALDAYADDPDLRHLILNGLGYAHESKGQYAQAAEYFKRIVNEDDTVMKDQALFNLGRIYGRMGAAAKQQEAYEQLVSDYPDSMYYQLAKEKLAA
jgi:tetratricopeptide (TPR) repeat protein